MKNKIKITYRKKNNEICEDTFTSSKRLGDIIKEFEVIHNPKMIYKVECAAMDDIVKIANYNKVDKMQRTDAIVFYEECACGSEGCERERYEYILTELRRGSKVINGNKY